MDCSSKFQKIVKENIKKYCQKKNISLKNLSEYTKISALEDILNADEIINISIEDLYRISVVLEINIDNFFLEL